MKAGKDGEKLTVTHTCQLYQNSTRDKPHLMPHLPIKMHMNVVKAVNIIIFFPHVIVFNLLVM